MATPTLGNTPTNINNCDSDNFTGADGTDADIKKVNNSVAWLARGDGDFCQFSVTNLALSTEHIRLWINHATVANLDIEANGGMEVYFVDGSDTGYWTMFGSDTYEGGWFYAIIYGGSSPTRNSGTAPAMTSVDNIGFMFQQASLPANKINTWIDEIKYGDGYYATGGTSGDEIDLAGIRALDVASAYGIVDTYQGVYYCSGELQIGNGATTTYFEMLSEVMVFIDAPVNTGLYKIIGDGSGCNIVIDDSVIRAAGSGDGTRFAIDMDETNLASFSLTDSFITRAAACTFKSGQTVTGNVFDDCGVITPTGADISNCVVKNYASSGSGAVYWNENTDPDTYTDGMSFTKGTATKHAFEFGDSIPTEITLRNIDFSGYNASTGQDDSALYFADTGGTITVNLVGCTGNISYKSAGATISLVINPVTTTIEVRDISTLAVIQGARVLVLPSDASGDLNYQTSVTQITRSGSTATVTQTAHGLSTDDKVYIQGANQPEYNGIHQITYISADSYSFAVSGTPDSPATGTIVETDVLISDVTNASGLATDTRSFSADQPITGRVREGTDPTPNYKTSPITGTVDKDTGLTAIIFLVQD